MIYHLENFQICFFLILFASFRYVRSDWSNSPRLCWSPRCPQNPSAPPPGWSLASPRTPKSCPPRWRRRGAATAAAATTAGPARAPSQPARGSNPSLRPPRPSSWLRGLWLASHGFLLPCCPAFPASRSFSNSSLPRLPLTFHTLRGSSTDRNWGFSLNTALKIDKKK